VTSLTLPLPSGRGTRGNGILRFLNDLADSFHEGLELARRYDTLAAKSDAELARLGLRRKDIPRAALLGRKR
jgi:uncharacterized protein YjiS (DUF1127 family)